MLEKGLAPWQKGKPPKFELIPIGEKGFRITPLRQGNHKTSNIDVLMSKSFNLPIYSYFMVRIRTVGKKGQVTIPKDIRDKYGLKKGEKVIFEERGDEIIMKPEKSGRELVNELASVVEKKSKAPEPEELKRIYYEQIEERLSGL
jgi:AbrB family looped-hinge helix DNA binding protein